MENPHHGKEVPKSRNMHMKEKNGFQRKGAIYPNPDLGPKANEL